MKKRGSGWHERAPFGKERQVLFNQCGQKCFLGKPTYTSTGKMIIKYPICAKCASRCSCQIDPQGLRAAHQRASQYGFKYKK